MNPILLNQVGIVMNFFAGFMLAPELIGEKRIKEFVHYRTESMSYSCGAFQPPAPGRLGQSGRHKEPVWDRDGLLEAAAEQPETQPK